MNYNFQTGTASETLQNHSVCVKDGDIIRNINHYTDIETESFVMVCNAERADIDSKVILKGEMVRYFKLAL